MSPLSVHSSLVSGLFVSIYHATVCLSQLITVNQDLGVFVIQKCFFLLCLPNCQPILPLTSEEMRHQEPS